MPNGRQGRLPLRIIALVVALQLNAGTFVHAAGQSASAGGALSAPDSAYAALGSSFIHDNHLDALGWTDAQVAAFAEGMRAAFAGKPIPFDEAARRLSAEVSARVREMENSAAPSAITAAQAAPLIAEVRRQFDLQQTASGLLYRVMAATGTAIRPRPQDTVIISFNVMAADGAKLPQLAVSRTRVKLAALLPGLVEGIQAMTVDAQAVLLLPPTLSFGDGDWPEGVTRGMPLVFFVTLHDVTAAAAP